MTVEQMLETARGRLRRVDAGAAFALQAAGATVVDIRPIHQRVEYGEIPGSVVVERNVLEWRFDPLSEARLRHVDDHDHRVVVVCQQGYTSSLAAASLQDLGLRNATDLVGGFEAWRDQGLPVVVGGTPAGMWVRKGLSGNAVVVLPSPTDVR